MTFPILHLPLLFLTGTLCLAQDVLLTVMNADDEGEGSLRAAIENVASEGKIIFDPALDGATITLTEAPLLIAKNLEIDADMLGDGITISRIADSEIRHRLIQVFPGVNATFSNLIFRNGATANGEDGQTGITNVDGKKASHGGAIFTAGNLSLIRCVLADNETGVGGNGGSGRGGSGGLGGAIFNSGELTLTDCTLSSNQTGTGGNGGGGEGGFGFGGSAGTGGAGGAIFNTVGGTLTMSGCTLNDNETGAGGIGGNGVGFSGNGGRGGLGGNGGALANLGTISVINCTFTDNTTGGGGLGGDAAQNSAGKGGFGGNGGAIHSEAGDFEMIHCTVTRNQTGEAGLGGFREGRAIRSGETGIIGAGGGVFTSHEITLTHCIVSANVAPALVDVAGPFNEVSQNVTDSNFPILLRPLGDYGGPTFTMPPFQGSPAVDAGSGTPDPNISFDQRGFERLTDRKGSGTALADLGAVELESSQAQFDTFFSTDTDNDGLSDGEELIIGSDPFTPDNQGLENLRFVTISKSTGHPRFSFAYQEPDIRLQVVRSSDLEIFETIIADSADPESFEVPDDDTLIQIEDENPPAGRAFYRLQAVRPN